MKILVIGSGGREHAIIWKLLKDGVEKIFCIPGNGGISRVAECSDISLENHRAIIEFVKEKGIDLTIVGPENPLVNGIVDDFESEGMVIFGPDRRCAMLEGSKVFAKEFMRKYNIPTADFAVFSDYDAAKKYIDTHSPPYVVKADGLAFGKGSFVCEDKEAALNAIFSIMKERIFGKAGDKIIVEEKLVGQEITLLAFCDGDSLAVLPISQDHKRLLDNDEGPNTGGMGAYSPVPFVDENLYQVIEERILKRFINGLKSEDLHYRGVIYFGLILTEKGPCVLEFNCRFGDPEAQVVLPFLRSKLVDCIDYTLHGKISKMELRKMDGACICVVVASKGYPKEYEKGKEIFGLEKDMPDTMIFHAGTRYDNGKFFTSGGRVLNVVGIGKDLASARNKAYLRLGRVRFDGYHYRRDIGLKGILKANRCAS